MSAVQQVMMMHNSSVSLSNLTFVSNTTSTTAGVTIPSDFAEGDIAVLFQYARGSGAYGGGTPTGWTLVANNRTTTGTGGTWGHISYKKMASGDPGTSATGGITGGQEQAKIMIGFRPNAPVTTVTISSLNQFAGTSDPADQTVTDPGTKPFIYFAHYVCGQGVFARSSNATMTEITSAAAATTEQFVRYLQYNVGDTSQNISVDEDGANNNVLQSFALSVS
jgi:hypothetical protein